MSELLSGLNPVQKEAASYTDGPLLILAGAGSGKTRVLTYRIAYLLEQGLCKPWEILAITFTNKAAKEMKERVTGLVGDEAKDMWLGTFHGICVRILKREIEALGFTRDFNILDELDKQKVLKELLKKFEIDEKNYSVSSLVNEISNAKNLMKTPEKYMKEATGDYRRETIAKIYDEYQRTLKLNNSLDFDDILNHTVELFKKNPDRLSYYQNKFKHILVDEYQDTNHVQFMLISMLAAMHGNVCVVGDESQSIYAFRGADISNILDFEKEYDGAKIVKLEQNYRSTKTILNVANAVINNNTSKIEKNLWTENDEGEKVKYYTAKNEYDEVEYIVDKIDSMCRTGKFKYGDFALLYRTNAQSRVIEDVFMKTGTPYRLIGGTKFYARKEIKDLLAYTKLVNNLKDNVSFTRIINEPKRGIGDTSVDRIKEKAESMGLSAFEYITEPANIAELRCSGAVNNFKELILDLNAVKDTMLPSELMKRILEVTGYEAELMKEKNPENESRLENLYELLGVAKEFEEENADNSLTDFLDSIALVADVDNLEEDAEAVILMTMHNAKGLEYPVVFLVGMEEGLFPSKRSIDEDNGIEEERRLCYVGITRAKKELFLTNAKQRTMYGTTTYTIPSRFTEEVPKEYLDEAAKENLEKTKMKQETYLDREYSRVESWLSSTFNEISESESMGGYSPRRAPSKIGIDASSFLKNVNIGKVVAKDNNKGADVKEGDKVRHKKFGVGIVTSLTEDSDMKVAEIKFETAGMKRLIITGTTLEIIG